MRHVLVVALGAVAAWGVGGNPSASDVAPIPPERASLPPWLTDVRVLVRGVGLSGSECRTGVCSHNENTDVVRFGGAIYVVHRTAQSQVLGPNSSLRVLRSDDGGASFSPIAVIPRRPTVTSATRTSTRSAASSPSRRSRACPSPRRATPTSPPSRSRARATTAGAGRRRGRSARRPGASGASSRAAASTTAPLTRTGTRASSSSARATAGAGRRAP